MTNPDGPHSRVLGALNQVTVAAGVVYVEAHRQGVLDGMEFVAQSLTLIEAGLGDDYRVDTEVRAIVSMMLTQVRDSLRLAALQLPEPSPPVPG